MSPSQRWNKVALTESWQPAQLLHCLLAHTGARTVCAFVVHCWSKPLGSLCRRQLEVDMPTAEWQDNREPVLRPSQTHKHAHDATQNGHPVSGLCFWEQQRSAYWKFYEMLVTNAEWHSLCWIGVTKCVSRGGGECQRSLSVTSLCINIFFVSSEKFYHKTISKI